MLSIVELNLLCNNTYIVSPKLLNHCFSFRLHPTQQQSSVKRLEATHSAVKFIDLQHNSGNGKSFITTRPEMPSQWNPTWMRRGLSCIKTQSFTRLGKRLIFRVQGINHLRLDVHMNVTFVTQKVGPEICLWIIPCCPRVTYEVTGGSNHVDITPQLI